MCRVCVKMLYVAFGKDGESMPMTEAKKMSNKKWNDANMKERYDRIQLVVPKGKKAELQAHAADCGESLNGFVNRAIDETVERDNERRGENASDG